MQDACTQRGLNVTSIALLGTVPIVPVLIEKNHTVGYVLGPILAVLAIASFFGAMAYLAYEKHRDIKDAQDVEGGKPKARRGGLSALAGILTCAACRGGRSRRSAAAKCAAPGAGAGAAPLKEQELTPNSKGAPAAGVSPARDPRNLSPLNLFKGGRRTGGAAAAPAVAQNEDFMTHNPMYGSGTPGAPATPGSAASGGRTPVADFFRRSSSQLSSAVGRVRTQRAPGQGQEAAAAGNAAEMETPRGAPSPRWDSLHATAF